MKKIGLGRKLIKYGTIIIGVLIINKALQSNEDNVINAECKEVKA